jgi:hypothetical protein
MEKKPRKNMFEKGKVANPNGRPKISHELKEIRRINGANLPVIVDKFLSMSREELEAAAKDKDTPAMECILIRVIVEAMKRGDDQRLNFLFDRIIGKTPETVNLNGNVHMAVLKLINRMHDHD